MEDWQIFELVIVCLGCALMAVHAAMVIRWLVRTRCASWGNLKLSSLKESLCSRVQRQSPEKADPLAAEVERLITERRMTVSKYTYLVVTRFFLLVEALILLNIVTDSPRFLTDGLTVIFHSVFIVLTIISVWPSLLTVNTVDIWYSVLMVIHSCAMTPIAVNKELIPYLSQSMVGVRIFGGLSSLNIPLVAFLEGLYLSVSVMSFGVGTSDCIGTPFTSTYAIGELVGCVGMTILLACIKRGMRLQARQEIEAWRARSETSAVSALLSTMGDAVVELDQNLQIVGHSQQLATMLLHGHHRDLSGTPFEELLAGEEDLRLFKEYMAKEVAIDQTLADVFHVKVRDGLSNCVRVEIFHVCKKSIGFSQNDHLLGIREDTDFDRADGFHITGVFAEPQPPLGPAGATAGPATFTDRDEVMVVIDAVTFEILQVTAAFIAMVGQRPANDHFSEWIASSSRSEFMKHFEGKVNKWLPTMKTASAVRITYKNMHMKIPLSANANFRIMATCTMVLRSQGNGAAGEGRPVAEAVFSNVDTVQPSKKNGQRRRNNGDDNDSSGSLASSFSSVGRTNVATNRQQPAQGSVAGAPAASSGRTSKDPDIEPVTIGKAESSSRARQPTSL